jgi:hypothetical protein
MKTLLKISAVLFVLLVVALVGGYFALTNAGVQKRLIEGQLPAGSSLEYVKVTTSHLELSGLVLMLADGTKVNVAEVDTSFSPLAAVFDKTIKLGALLVDGLRIDLPAAAPASVASAGSGTQGAQDAQALSPEPAPKKTKAPKKAKAATNPLDALYQLGEFEWLLDVEGIALDGLMKDAAGTTYTVRVRSGPIRPGAQSTVDAAVKLVSDEPLQAGLKQFDSHATLGFKQKKTGGFENLRLESNTSGQDANGGNLLSVNQVLDLVIQGSDESANLTLQFDADLPRPELLAPELVAVGALQVRGQATVEMSGKVSILTSAELAAQVNGAQVLALDLKKSMTLGGKQDFTGELLDLKVTNLPLTWLGLWLPAGMTVEGTPVSLQIAVEGDAAGALSVRSVAPIAIGPLMMRDAEALLLQNVSLLIDPVIKIGEDGSLDYTLKAFRVSDQYGQLIDGIVSGVIRASDRKPGHLFAGVKTKAKFQIGLQELFQQPVLADQASILGGTLALELQVDGAAEYPVQAQGKIKALRPRTQPGNVRDYRFALQVQDTAFGEWTVGANFQVGSDDQPSTSLQFSGKSNPSKQPLTFSAELSGPTVALSDFSLLSAAFSPQDTPSDSPVRTTETGASRPTSSPSGAPAPAVMTAPPWQYLDGKAVVEISELTLESGKVVRDLNAKAVVTKSQLLFDGISAKIGPSGSLSGKVEVLYAPSAANLYSVLAKFGFSQIEPSVFADQKSGTFPVQGIFDGAFNLVGGGQTLASALENSNSDLRVTGKNGILTAFELDNRSQLGLGLVGIFGQSFDRPGITALSNTVPYFIDMRFSDFILELKRGEDKRVVLPQLKFTGESLLIDGSGFVAASSLGEVMNQPLDLTLKFGAKGRLVDHLETLKLLKPTTDEEGFRQWNKDVRIGGTLAKPNAEALMDLLKFAANSALSKPTQQEPASAVPGAELQAAPSPEEVPAKKTKEEKRRDDVEIGLDLLNSILGN